MARKKYTYDTPPVRLKCRYCRRSVQGYNQNSAWVKLASHVLNAHPEVEIDKDALDVKWPGEEK